MHARHHPVHNPPPLIRPARLTDLDELLRLEEVCFVSDRMSRRSFRHALTRGHAVCLVAGGEARLAGYALVYFHTGTSLARLYSIAVDPAARGRGLGERLLAAAEDAARERGCVSMRLEIRRDNAPALALYRRMGYRKFGVFADYYEDHMDALRMEKSLVSHLRPSLARVPYYEQTLEFTCGPAVLIMAMQALDPGLHADRKLELRLWRESTTVFMTAGHGGCGPYGLALAAWRRGFDVAVYVRDEGALFVDSVRSEEKKEVIRLVQEDFLEELKASGVSLHYSVPGAAELQREFETGGIPLVLISSYRLYREKFPHWVVVTGFDERFVYVHDPYVDYEKDKARADCLNMPILKRDFERMARYGKSGQRAVVILRKRT